MEVLIICHRICNKDKIIFSCYENHFKAVLYLYISYHDPWHYIRGMNLGNIVGQKGLRNEFSMVCLVRHKNNNQKYNSSNLCYT